MVTRRRFFEASGLAGFGLVAGRPVDPVSARVVQDPLPPLNRPSGPAATVARDEAYWGRVRAYYRVADEFTNLEAGYYGMMALPVLGGSASVSESSGLRPPRRASFGRSLQWNISIVAGTPARSHSTQRDSVSTKQPPAPVNPDLPAARPGSQTAADRGSASLGDLRLRRDRGRRKMRRRPRCKP